VSCKKAQDVFTQKNADVKNSDDARKRIIKADDAWAIIKKYKKILIGKGKKSVEYTPEDETKEEILKAALGRSGNLRAPSVEVNGILIIGYNDDLYNGIT